MSPIKRARIAFEDAAKALLAEPDPWVFEIVSGALGELLRRDPKEVARVCIHDGRSLAQVLDGCKDFIKRNAKATGDDRSHAYRMPAGLDSAEADIIRNFCKANDFVVVPEEA